MIVAVDPQLHLALLYAETDRIVRAAEHIRAHADHKAERRFRRRLQCYWLKRTGDRLIRRMPSPSGVR